MNLDALARHDERDRLCAGARGVALTAAGLAAAGGIHLGLGAQHGFGGHGTRFLAAGALQVAAAALAWWAPGRRVVGAAGALSLALAAAWVLTRTSLLGGAEPVDALGAVTFGLEVGTGAVAFTVLRHSRPTPLRPPRRPPPRSRATAATAGGLVVLIGLSAGWAAPSAHDDHHHVGNHGPRAVTVAADDARPSIFGELFADHHDVHGDVAGTPTEELVPADTTARDLPADAAHAHGEGDHGH